MAEIDKIHSLSEAIYKNLLDNYTPGIKQLITSGRAFQKALQSVVTSSKAYVDCIYTLARNAHVCKGATSELGAALLQIAEVYKEINTQVLDNIKTFHSELLIPLETGHDRDAKTLQTIYKKYLTGHKYYVVPFEKSQAALRKQQKRNKNKFGFDQKELQITRELKESQARLEVYHQEQLRCALSEERQRYCGLLGNICTVVRSDASHHSKANDLQTHCLAEWSRLCQNPHILPESSEAVIDAFCNPQDDVYSNTDEINAGDSRGGPGHPGQQNHSTPHTPAHSRHQPNHHHVPAYSSGGEGGGGGMRGGNAPDHNHGYSSSAHAQRIPQHHNHGRLVTSQDDYAVAGLQRSISIYDQQACPGGNGLFHSNKVRALYAHRATGVGTGGTGGGGGGGNSDTQMNFDEGDVITLIGAPRDGWQYGENLRTRRMGWFPVSFTEPLQTGSADAHVSIVPMMSQRVKSLGNLREITDDEDFHHTPVGDMMGQSSAMTGGVVNNSSAPPPHSGYSDSDSGHGADIAQRNGRQAVVYRGQPSTNKQLRVKRCVSWAESDSRPLVPNRRQSLLPDTMPRPKFELIVEYLNTALASRQSPPSPPLPPPPPAHPHDTERPSPGPSTSSYSNVTLRPPFLHTHSTPVLPARHAIFDYVTNQDGGSSHYQQAGGGGVANTGVVTSYATGGSPANSSSGYSGSGLGGGSYRGCGDFPPLPPPPLAPPPPPQMPTNNDRGSVYGQLGGRGQRQGAFRMY